MPEAAPTAEPVRVTASRDEVLDEIRAARDTLPHKNDPIFVGINNRGLHSDGTRVDGQSLLRTFDEDGWRRELMIYAKADLKVKGVEPFKGEITHVVTIDALDTEPLEVRYYGIEPKEEGVWGHGPGVLDPRAHIVPGVLTETEIAWPFVYVYAEIRAVTDVITVDEVDYAERNAKSANDQAARVLAAGLLRDWDLSKSMDRPGRDVSPGPRRRTPVQTIDEEPEWSAPSAATPAGGTCAFPVMAEHWDTGSPEPVSGKQTFTDPRNAERLQIDAKQAAVQGDHKTAYQLMEKAISLVCSSREERNVPTAHEVDYAPMREEMPDLSADGMAPSGQADVPRSFKPAVPYHLSDGTTHVIPAGLYTEDEWFAATLKAQGLVASGGTGGGSSSKDALTPANMSKYAAPLTRSESQAESMASAEELRDVITTKAAAARDVMQASLSKDASPIVAPAPAPEPLGTSDVLSLGASLADASEALEGEERVRTMPTTSELVDGMSGIKIDIKGEQQTKWDDAASKLAAQAASIWGPKP